MTRKSSKTARILEQQLVSKSTATTSAPKTSTTSPTTTAATAGAGAGAVSKPNSEKNERPSKESSLPADSSPFSFFYSLIPKEIMGVPVSEIKRDTLNEMTNLTT